MHPLDKVAAKIEQGWTQEAFARDAKGNTVDSNSPKAVCWCLRGAMQEEEAGDAYYWVNRSLINALETKTGRVNLTAFNDMPGRTKEDVLQLIQAAKEFYD
jgi:hypothetical protein